MSRNIKLFLPFGIFSNNQYENIKKKDKIHDIYMAFRLFLRIVTVILLFTSVYLCVYLIQSLEESRKTTYELNKANDELFRLREENARLEKLNSDKNHIIEVSYEIAKKRETEFLNERKIKQDLQNLLNNAQGNIQTLEAKLRKTKEFKKHSIQFEILRRKISNQIKEMSFYISSLLGKLRHNEENATRGVEKYLGLGNFEELQRITESDFDQLMKLDSAQVARNQTAIELSDIVLKRLHKLQHPQWCRSARKLVCRLKRNCGYGCQIHKVLFSFIVSYATKRTLIIDSSDWLNSNQGWDAYFQPVSTSCRDFTDPQLWHSSHEEYRVVELPQIEIINPRLETMPLAVPRDLYDQIRSFHGHPFVWWVSQFTKYLLRLTPQLKDKVRSKKTRLQFKRPIVG